MSHNSLMRSREKRRKYTPIDSKSLLVLLRTLIDWETFRGYLNMALHRGLSSERKRGRPAYDAVMMLRIIILRELNEFSDDRMEEELREHRDYREFVGIADNGRIPDAKTIWLFRHKLAESDSVRVLFEAFLAVLLKRGSSRGTRA